MVLCHRRSIETLGAMRRFAALVRLAAALSVVLLFLCVGSGALLAAVSEVMLFVASDAHPNLSMGATAFEFLGVAFLLCCALTSAAGIYGYVRNRRWTAILIPLLWLPICGMLLLGFAAAGLGTSTIMPDVIIFSAITSWFLLAFLHIRSRRNSMLRLMRIDLERPSSTRITADP